MKSTERIALALIAGCIATAVYLYVWPRYFGWYHLGGAFQFAPLLREVLGPSTLLLMGAFVAICVWSVSRTNAGRHERFDHVQFKLQPSARRGDLVAITLEAFPANGKIRTIKVVRELTGAGLKDAKDLVENLPGTIWESATPAQAAAIRAKLTALGAEVICSQVSLPRNG